MHGHDKGRRSRVDRKSNGFLVSYLHRWGFPKIKGTFLGDPHKIGLWYFGVYIGVLLLREKYQMGFRV